jgi:hypothetical protein
MSQEDAMVLAARIKDEFSGPVRDMTKAWNQFTDILKHGQAEGAKGAKEHGKQVGELRDKFKEMRREVVEGIKPAFEELGISMFTVGGAMAGVVATLKQAADQFGVLQDASRRAGASVDYLQSTAMTLSNLTGTSTAEATQDLATFAEHLARMARGRSDTVNAWRSTYAGLWESLGNQLKGLSLPEAMQRTMEFFDKHPEIAIDKRRDILGLEGLPAGLATKSLKEFNEETARNNKLLSDHPYDAKAAERLDDAFKEMRRTIFGLGQEMVHVFGADGATMNDKLSNRIESFAGGLGDYVDFMGGKAKPDNKYLRELRGGNERYGTGEADYGPTGTSGDGPNSWLYDYFHPKNIKPRVRPGDAATPGFHPTGFTTGGDAESMFSRGVHSGTLAALQDWYASLSAKHGGIVPASYGGGGGGSGGGVACIAAAATTCFLRAIQAATCRAAVLILQLAAVIMRPAVEVMAAAAVKQARLGTAVASPRSLPTTRRCASG